MKKELIVYTCDICKKETEPIRITEYCIPIIDHDPHTDKDYAVKRKIDFCSCCELKLAYCIDKLKQEVIER